MPSLLTAWRLSLILVAPVYSGRACVCLSSACLSGRGGPVGAHGGIPRPHVPGKCFFFGQTPSPVLGRNTLPRRNGLCTVAPVRRQGAAFFQQAMLLTSSWDVKITSRFVSLNIASLMPPSSKKGRNSKPTPVSLLEHIYNSNANSCS